VRSDLRGLTFVLAACALLLVALAAGLRPDTFYVGDPGVKLVSARNAIRFPTHPLAIPLPRIGNDAVPHVDPFFAVHGDHAHAVTSEFFPLMSAPLLAWLGLRGLYVLPALGFLATLAGAAWLSSVLEARRSTVLVALAMALGTPFLFYGLEFWEHMPALGLATCGAGLLLESARRAPGRDAAPGATFAAGLLLGLGTMLRPELGCFALAVFIASRTLVHRPTWRSLVVAATGMIVALLPLEAYAVVHFGSWVPGHVGTNTALLGAGWLGERVVYARDWLLPAGWTLAGPTRTNSLWSVAPAAIVAMIGAMRTSGRSERAFLWWTALLTVAFTLLLAPNDGGGQWGPRYLLAAYVPLTLLAVDTLEELPRRAWSHAAIVLLLLASVWVQRSAHRTLRGAKNTYGRLADAVARVAEPGRPVITDAWWVDQLAAASLDRHPVFVAGSANDARDIVQRFSDLTVPSITVIRSRENAADVSAFMAGTCYFEEAKEEVDVRQVVIYRLRHRCGHTEQNR